MMGTERSERFLSFVLQVRAGGQNAYAFNRYSTKQSRLLQEGNIVGLLRYNMME
jgi:hypothetical protein